MMKLAVEKLRWQRVIIVIYIQFVIRHRRMKIYKFRVMVKVI